MYLILNNFELLKQNILFATPTPAAKSRFRLLGTNAFNNRCTTGTMREVMGDMYACPILTLISVVSHVLKGNCITENMSRKGSCH